MKKLHSFLVPVLFLSLLFNACAVNRQITPENVEKNMVVISDVTKYMFEHKQDTLRKKYCERSIKKKFRKLKIDWVTRANHKIYFYPDTVQDTLFEFNNSGGIFHYQQTIMIIPVKSKDKYNLKKLGSNFEKVNDTIYIGTWPFIALM